MSELAISLALSEILPLLPAPVVPDAATATTSERSIRFAIGAIASEIAVA